jgi:dTDP-glucose 4,6-dehydratase
MKIGILGGGNCYALNLANLCKQEGIDVFGIGRSPQKVPAMWQVFHGYRYYQAHLVTQLEAVMAILGTERPDVIVNFAAQGEGQASFGEKARYFYNTNTTALADLAWCLHDNKYFKRFIQIGTSELYGSVTAPSKETDPLNPSSPYAVSKAAFDQHLGIMRRVHGFPATIIRPSNCFTRGQQLHRIIPRAIIAALSGNKLQLQGGGVAQKSYLSADDLSRAVLKSLSLEQDTFNCGPDSPVSIRHVVELCIDACGNTFDDVVELAPERQGQDSMYWIDSSKLKSHGWKPQVSLAKGIDDMVSWVKRYPEILSMRIDWEVRP